MSIPNHTVVFASSPNAPPRGQEHMVCWLLLILLIGDVVDDLDVMPICRGRTASRRFKYSWSNVQFLASLTKLNSSTRLHNTPSYNLDHHLSRFKKMVKLYSYTSWVLQ